MRSTLLNPTLWLLVALAASAAVAFARGEPAHVALSRVVSWAARAPLLVVIGLAAAGGVASRVAVGYLSPGSYAEEVLAARSFLDQRQLYRGDDRRDFSRWLTEEPAPVNPWTLPGLTVCQANAAESRPEFYTAQGHSPVLLVSSVPVVAIGGGRTLYLALTVLSMAGLAAMGLALARSLGLPPTSPRALLLAAGLFSWQPVLAGIRQGDAVVIVAALFVAAWASLRDERPVRAGLATGVAAALLVPAIALMVPAAARSRRTVAVALATALAATAATVIVAGPMIFVDYAASTTASARLYDASPMAYSVVGQLLRVNAAGASLVAWGAAILGVISLGAWIAGSRGPGRADLTFALFAALAYLWLPVAWSQHVTLLLIPIAVLAWRVLAFDRPLALVLLAAIVIALSLPDQAVGRIGIALGLSGGPAGITGAPPVTVWAALALWGWLVAAHVRPAPAGYRLLGR